MTRRKKEILKILKDWGYEPDRPYGEVADALLASERELVKEVVEAYSKWNSAKWDDYEKNARDDLFHAIKAVAQRLEEKDDKK